MTEPVEVWLNALVNVAHGAERKQRELRSEPVLDTHESIPARALVERKTRHATMARAVNRRFMNASRMPDVTSETGTGVGDGGDGRPPPGALSTPRHFRYAWRPVRGARVISAPSPR